MVRDRLAQADAADGFLLDGYPRNVAQVGGARRDPRRRRSDARPRGRDHGGPGRRGRAAAQACRDRGPRGRHRGRHPAPARRLRRGDRPDRRRCTPSAACSSQVDGIGDVDAVTERLVAAIGATDRALTRVRPRADRVQDARSRCCSCGARAWSSPRRWPRSVSARRPASPPRQLDAVAAEVIADHRRDAVVPRLPRLPGDAVRLGQRRGRARHPGCRGCWSRATWSRSTAARSSTAGTATPRSRSSSTAPTPQDVDLAATTERAMWAGIAALAGGRAPRRRGGGRRGRRRRRRGGRPERRRAVRPRRGVRRPRDRHAMHQPPDVPNFRSRDRGPRLRPGLCVAVEPMVVRGQRFTQVLDDDWTVVTDDGSRASHWEHTVADPRGRHLGADGGRRRRAGARRARGDRRSARLSGHSYPPVGPTR